MRDNKQEAGKSMPREIAVYKKPPQNIKIQVMTLGGGGQWISPHCHQDQEDPSLPHHPPNPVGVHPFSIRQSQGTNF